MSAFSLRFVCPHCHAPIDPRQLETAVDGEEEFRVCPECDEMIAFTASVPDDGHVAGGRQPAISAGLLVERRAGVSSS